MRIGAPQHFSIKHIQYFSIGQEHCLAGDYVPGIPPGGYLANESVIVLHLVTSTQLILP